MAFDGLSFPAQIKKLTIRAIITSTRPISNHPFLVSGFLFVIFLYRSSPFLFSLLVSASPVLVCTAILLGTLLAYGHPQIPEIDKDKNAISEISSSRAIPFQNNTTVFYEEAMVFSNGRQLSLADNDNGRQVSVVNSNQGGLSPWRSREIAFDQQCVEQSVNEHKRQHIVISNANHEEMLQFEDTNSILISDEDEEEDYEPSDSGSDGAESSSPEPSMADIIPLLDEIDPLIECENSGLLSNGSHSSNESGINSDEETDHKEAEEEEEEEDQANKEDQEKSAITWTEDDQKNFMDLGSSELERNHRLETLIVRRRARRSMNERNLIDLDGFDLTISTTRQNPFDFPNVSYDDIGLPPVPGSAPSILLPRRNPFDLPYDSSEEKPDLTGDSFQQEFTQVSQKEPVFRRHESFNIGSSHFQRATRFRPYFVAECSFMRQSSEVSESSSSYQRQSSDVSESKASSAAEIEQVCAEEVIMDHASDHVEYGSQSSQVLDDQYENNRDFDVHMPEIRLGESELLTSPDFKQDEIEHLCAEEIVPNSAMDHASDHVEHGSPSSQILDGDSDVLLPEIRLGESETLTTTNFNQDEREHIAEISFGSGGKDPNIDSWLFDGRNLAASTENNVEVDLMEEEEEYNDVQEEENNEIGLSFMETSLMLETIDEEYISSSSLSIVSEEDNFMESVKHDDDDDDDKAMVNLDHIKSEVDENFDVPILDVSSSSHERDLDDGHFEEPVYDSSPRASKNRLLEESAESDVEQEVSERVADELNSSNGQADLAFLVTELTEEPELVNKDALLSKEKPVSVADEAYSIKDEHVTNLYPSDSQEESFVNPEKLEEVVEPESSETIEKPCVQNAEKSAPDASFDDPTVEIPAYDPTMEEHIKSSSVAEQLTSPRVIDNLKNSPSHQFESTHLETSTESLSAVEKSIG